jgi:tight adherence protein B
MDTQAVYEWAIVGSVFGAVLAVWLFVVILWTSFSSSRSRQVQERLGLSASLPAEARVLRLWKDGQETTTTVLRRRPASVLARVDRMRTEAGLKAPAQALVLGLVGVCLLLFATAAVITHTIEAGVGVCIVTVFLAWIFVQNRISRRLVRFESQLVDALELTARSLKAGHTLVGSFRLVSEELPAPVNGVFGEICQLQALGLSLEEALDRTARSSGSGDMQLFATSVIIQLRSGGNLAEMMNRLSFVIRDRMRLKRRVRVLTAQVGMSKRVLMILPFALFAILNILNPEYMSMLYTTQVGKYMMMIALAGIVSGIYVMNKLSVLHY